MAEVDRSGQLDEKELLWFVFGRHKTENQAFETGGLKYTGENFDK